MAPQNRRMAMFLVRLLPLIAASYLAYHWVDDTRFFEVYLYLNAKAACFVASPFLELTHVEESTILIGSTSLQIKKGCDGLQSLFFFVSAVLSFPASAKGKLLGILAGVLALIPLNVFRVVTLMFARVYLPSTFDSLHIDVWPPGFVVCLLLVWLVWAWRHSAPSVRSSARAL